MPRDDAEGVGARRRHHAWEPVLLVKLDVDYPEESDLRDVPPGRRAWIEVVRTGQVIGLVEARGEERGVPHEVVEAVRRVFGTTPVSPVELVANPQLPSATVVVPTVGRDVDLLNEAVEAILESAYPTFEVIVVDNRAEASPPLGLKSVDERLRVTHEPRPGAAAARNRGAREAIGQIVAFTDDDATVDRTWLRALGARFVLSPEAAAVGGLVLPKELDTQPQLWFEEFYGGLNRSFRAEVVDRATAARQDRLSPYAPGRFGNGNNIAFRRQEFLDAGGFLDTLGPGTPAMGGEDLEVLFRLLDRGASLAIEPAAVVRHVNRRTRAEFVTQVLRYGTGLTAMYTAIVIGDPRHAPAILRRVPAGLRRLFRRRSHRSPSATPSCPRRTYAYQVIGMAFGPVAYLMSAARLRRGR